MKAYDNRVTLITKQQFEGIMVLLTRDYAHDEVHAIFRGRERVTPGSVDDLIRMRRGEAPQGMHTVGALRLLRLLASIPPLTIEQQVEEYNQWLRDTCPEGVGQMSLRRENGKVIGLRFTKGHLTGKVPSGRPRRG